MLIGLIASLAPLTVHPCTTSPARPTNLHQSMFTLRNRIVPLSPGSSRYVTSGFPLGLRDDSWKGHWSLLVSDRSSSVRRKGPPMETSKDLRADRYVSACLLTRQRRWWTVALACLLTSSVWPSPGSAEHRSTPRLYELVTETAMPHLEENLRYATTHERRCIDTSDLSTEFPALSYPSLWDCRLVRTKGEASFAIYALHCTGGHGTTGGARWRFDRTSISGTLNVKLGGKNMTFYQRITGRVVSQCSGS